MVPPARFGRFELLERRGTGGMGEVWRASMQGPRGFAQEVVLKRIRRLHTDDDGFVAMLAAEARICARLNHPGLVRVFEFGEVDGEPYLAMELVDGWNLAEVLWACTRAHRPAPVELVCHVGAQVAEALAYAHDLRDEAGRPLGLVHRDVNPANVMVTRHGSVKLLDFGVHTLRERIPEERTRAGVLKGTLGYMSPEQTRGEPVDARSDLFSLGVVLHEALSRQRLFRVVSDAETIERIRDRVVPPPSASRPEIPPELDAIVLRLLERDPAARYPDAGAVASDLRALARRLGADDAWVRSFLAGLAMDTEPSAGGAPQRRTEALLPRPRSWRPWIIAALVTLGCALPYVFAEQPRRSTPPAAAPRP
jgi:serine/threonine protein kinase